MSSLDTLKSLQVTSTPEKEISNPDTEMTSQEVTQQNTEELKAVNQIAEKGMQEVVATNVQVEEILANGEQEQKDESRNTLEVAPEKTKAKVASKSAAAKKRKKSQPKNFKAAFEILQNNANQLQQQTEPDIDNLMTTVEESIIAYKVCQERINAVQSALDAVFDDGIETSDNSTDADKQSVVNNTATSTEVE